MKEIGPCEANFQAPVQAHHTYVWHACTNVLDDLTRPSGAPGYGIWPVFALLWYKTIIIWLKSQNLKIS